MRQSFYLFIALSLSLATPLAGQKPALTLDAIDKWNQIEDPKLSPNGQWAAYHLQPNTGDPSVYLYQASSQSSLTFPHASNAQFSFDSRFLAFEIHPLQDTVKAMRRRKVKKKDLPNDTLALLTLGESQPLKIPNVKAFYMPEKWEGWMAYHLEPMPRDSSLPDSVKVKKENNDNGSTLVIRNLRTGQEDSIRYVKSFTAAEEASRFLIHSTGQDSSFQKGIYLFDCPTRQLTPLLAGQGHYGKMAIHQSGTRAAFLALQDTLEHRATPYSLYHWQNGALTAAADTTAAFLPDGWLISEHRTPEFSENGDRLFFGIAPPPLLPDTTLLEEEKVQVEVWTYQDKRLYTQEEVRLESTRKKSYDCVWLSSTRQAVQLGRPGIPDITLGNEGNAAYALGTNEEPYVLPSSWEGFPVRRDIYLIEVETGKSTRIAKGIAGSPRLSPKARYAYWYSQPDSIWYAYSIEKKELHTLATAVSTPFYDELNDRPMHPSPYGLAGWTTEDDFIMLYDRYDIWLIDPLDNLAPNNLTEGRKSRTRYRYITLDPEERSIEEVRPMLFHTFSEEDKSSGYAWFNIHTGVKNQIQKGPFDYSARVQKAAKSNTLLFTRESFTEFPDLRISTDNLESHTAISKANPQQSSYRWGTAEPYSWTGADGQHMEGILIKPEGFDPSRKYPMMTYFYERYADRLHTHWAPRYPRSFINFPYYASRGYVIFIPDIHYRVGYPGESALDAITTGVTSLLDRGFIDKDRLGVQGHSWGGYQSAYLITQTDLFKCAESGAPVVNMTSAYGGIRWASGLSRMFQYEHTQSRLGGSLWDKPLRYIENSPLFYADKINTPVLILHNDEDGAVPWYQGIEFFVALRRLGKPAWLLNYNGEPHGVRKPENRRDFMQRMQQFFDYYLLDAPMPDWMKSGVPPIAKGLNQGF